MFLTSSLLYISKLLIPGFASEICTSTRNFSISSLSKSKSFVCLCCLAQSQYTLEGTCLLCYKKSICKSLGICRVCSASARRRLYSSSSSSSKSMGLCMIRLLHNLMVLKEINDCEDC
ncbi:hypothetical protein LOK49_LG08G00477 [Camellia lanceoleosa]|uniref:Uncharacterized protein n=1 Tax=Camellia lanceoleosa TaxID=1840588 RepID=A0ACC0GRU4_9ERIC|nr:hypothetical protein LOK49_LG08G00477 [Camellia lanceoleosa]